MSAAKPFTLRERRRMAQDFGYRPTNDWGSGPLPAPWCPGDVVEATGEVGHIGVLARFYVVVCAFSIDEGDAWYFRVQPQDGEPCSGRLYVASAARSTWDKDVDWMAPFTLVETPDPEGLAERERLLPSFALVDEPCVACRGSGSTQRWRCDT